MNILTGVLFNIKGLWLGLKTPKLLLLGLARFAVILTVTIVAAWLILFYHAELLNLIWKKPESTLVIWLWHVVSWFLSFLLVGVSAIISYLLAQILFAVIFMDLMSRTTERLLTGTVQEPKNIPFLQLFFTLVRQELPRAVIPVLISLILMFQELRLSSLHGTTPILSRHGGWCVSRNDSVSCSTISFFTLVLACLFSSPGSISSSFHSARWAVQSSMWKEKRNTRLAQKSSRQIQETGIHRPKEKKLVSA